MVEQALLGTLLVAPHLTSRCDGLTGASFADPLRGRVFDEIKELGEFADANLLVLQLEAKNVKPPHGHWWGEMVGRMLDKYFVDDDAVDVYVTKILEAAIERRMESRNKW